MKYLETFKTREKYGESELTEVEGLTFDEILSRSKEFVEWRRSNIKRSTDIIHQKVVEVERVVVRNNGTIYISWEDENELTYRHNVDNVDMFFDFIKDPKFFKTREKYNL